MVGRLALILLVCQVCSVYAQPSSSAKSPASPSALAERWRYFHPDRLGNPNREEKLYVLHQLYYHVRNGGSSGLNPPALLTDLETLSQAEDRELSLAALHILNLLGRQALPAADSVCEVALTGSSQYVRVEAICCLYAMGDHPTVVKTMKSLLDDEDQEIRFFSAVVLAELDKAYLEHALPILSSSLRHPKLRIWAAAALGRHGTASLETLPAMRSLLTDLKSESASPEILNAVHEAIRRVEGHLVNEPLLPQDPHPTRVTPYSFFPGV